MGARHSALSLIAILLLLPFLSGFAPAEEKKKAKYDIPKIKADTRKALSAIDSPMVNLDYICTDFLDGITTGATKPAKVKRDKTGKVIKKEGAFAIDYGNHFVVIGNTTYYKQGNVGSAGTGYPCGTNNNKQITPNPKVAVAGACTCCGSYPYYSFTY